MNFNKFSKSLVLLAVFASSSAFAAERTWICPMKDTSAAPYVTFIVRSATADSASISYVASAFFGSEEVVIEQPVPGCQADENHAVEITARSLYIECDGDGDAGFLSANKSGRSRSFKGSMTFPNSGVAGIDDRGVRITCTEQR